MAMAGSSFEQKLSTRFVTVWVWKVILFHLLRVLLYSKC